MRNQRLDDLFFRYCEKIITDEEREELMAMLLSDDHREQINGLIDQFMRSDGSKHTLSDETADDILSSIFSATGERNVIEEPRAHEDETRTRPMWLFKLAAASVVLFLVYGGYRWLNRAKPVPQVAVLQSVYGDDAPAGGNKASLTLADGRTYDLNTITEGNLAVQPGTTIDKSKGEVIYENTANGGAVAYNVLKTPLGGQYKIVLPDGSRAWLNAGSSLKYPTAFQGNRRDVEMTGEVYFEIEPDKSRPFLVRVADKNAKGKDMEITVLGTHFNISSYGDEPTMQTTLLEGSVRVEKDAVTKVLTPGQQARVATGEKSDIAVKTVDTESVVAWKEGRFEFNGNIREIMRQISRWYDLDVKYEGDVEKKSFAGTISRKNNVSEVLKMLEMTGGIQFRIDDRKITVKNAD
ncbi:FecR family protein [Dyadobacter fermentans]|uniref:Anti-FecI sigma factor, FecR n=1 Tax=Dyadobacter fermentans (strain ATCC 700827 / DSM 18053 / CIP 107007 / KCTC 52180 / NS114) TaxID=471854 RepID=C6W719_DYAFD|nr:FecR family protein [Dyadobacter fermentans]ACT92628.1 anti-FecI sigma factor, FecR [Dyadobacter fermentans DSM 18053]